MNWKDMRDIPRASEPVFLYAKVKDMEYFGFGYLGGGIAVVEVSTNIKATHWCRPEAPKD